MGCLALKVERLRAVDGHNVPFGNLVAARALFTRPISTSGFQRLSVESCYAIWNWCLKFDVRINETGEKGKVDRL